jgi:hypothetical protein
MKGYVYVLINSAFPDLVKIGRTTNHPKTRAEELYRTGTPEKYVVAHHVLTSDCIDLERRLHLYFENKRFNKDREFFEVSVEDVIKAIASFSGVEIYNESETLELNTIKVRAYLIIFGLQGLFLRFGVLPDREDYQIIGKNFTSLGTVDQYLESNNFQSQLWSYYDHLRIKNYGTLEATPVDERLLSPAEGLNFSKVLASKSFDVSQSFYESSSEKINSLQAEFMAFLINCQYYKKVADNQTFTERDSLRFGWDYWKSTSYLAKNDYILDLLISVFSDFCEIFEEEQRWLKTRLAKNNFYTLLSSAPQEIQSKWDVKYIEENITSEGGWIAMDILKERLKEQIESHKISIFFKGKV